MALMRSMVLEEMADLEWPHIAKFYEIEEKNDSEA